MNESPNEHLEIERKYEVSLDARVPDFAHSDWQLSAPKVFELDAQYFDTEDFLLARHRIAVRHRSGGIDAGWHIKQRTPQGVQETEWPDTPEMPTALTDTLVRLLGAPVATLTVVGRISTNRTTYDLLDTEQMKRAELVDDTVQTRDEVRGIARAWREWEVELAPQCDETVLDAIESELVTAGALPSLAESKIGRTMGTMLATAQRNGASAEALAAIAITDVADQMAAEHRDERVASLRQIARNLTA